MAEKCYWIFCFVPPASTSEARIFTFAEFLSALALLVVLYTISDFRYKFRLAITPGYLYQTTFAVIIFVGMGSLVGELWNAEGWWVLKSAGLNFYRWQTLLGVLFLGAFLTWAWYAFLRPPIFSKRNALTYVRAVYRVVVKGSDEELRIVANELSRSTDSIMRIYSEKPPQKTETRKPRAWDYVHDLLLLIANRKLCRHIVASSPVTAITLFDAAVKHKAYSAPLGMFARTISAEAIANVDSILHHEDDEYHDGLMGQIQPWRTAIFGNYQLMEVLGQRHSSPLDVSYKYYFDWKAVHWEAYASVVLTALNAYLTADRRHGISHCLGDAFRILEHGASCLRGLNGVGEGAWQDDRFRRFRAITEFYKSATKALDEAEKPPHPNPRPRDGYGVNDIYDDLADLGLHILMDASQVGSPQDLSWAVQHNTAWTALFERFRKNGRAGRAVEQKLRRKVIDEIRSIEAFPNYRNARLIGLLLNVLGTNEHAKKEKGYRDASRRLARVVLPLVKKNYLKLRHEYPDVADWMLVGGISFDEEEGRIVKTYAKLIDREPRRTYLQLDPFVPPPQPLPVASEG